MNEDKLKSFIDSNRNSFDDFTPGDDLWGKIDADLPQRPRMIRLSRVVAIAAMIVVVGGVGIWLSSTEDNSQPIASVEVKEESDVTPVSLSDLGPEMAEVEGYYTVAVKSKLEELQQYEVDPEILEEVEFLQQEFEALKKEMGRGVQRQTVLEAMIENYRLRLEILEDLLEELKKHNNEKNVHEVA